MTLFDWHLNTGDSFHGMLDFQRVYEQLFEPFTISPGVVLPAAEYRFNRFRSNLFTTAARRRLSGGMTVFWGDFWSGTAEQVTANVTFRVPPHFTARIFTSNVNYTASPRLAFSNLVQYDNRSRNLGWQSRVRWTLRPGDDLFFVFNQGWIQESGENLRFDAMDRKISAKFQYGFRF
jgi:hypothetical protein